MGEGVDDFDRLGAAVARVLREAFDTAEEVRREGVTDAGALAAQVGTEIERSLREALSVQSHVRREAEGVVESVRATTESARRAIEEIVEAARREADQLRSDAAAEASALVDTARATLERTQAIVEAERASHERDLERVIGDLQTAVDAMQADNVARRRVTLERAGAEAAAILRQARMHHRAVAAEVDRMIEAAATEAASLRKAAREDALRIAAEVSSVVDLSPRPAPRRPDTAGRRRAG